MRITTFQVRLFRVPYEATRTATHLVLQLRTDQGLEGLGYTTVPTAQGWQMKPLKPAVEWLCEQIVGQDPLATEQTTANLLAKANGALTGLIHRAISVIDVALWDLKGKALNQPIYKLIGGSRERVPVYASWKLWAQNDLDVLARNAAGFAEAGFKAMKYRLGGIDTAAGVIDRTRAMRDAVGPDVKLMADVNQGWNLKQSLTLGRELAAFDVFWLEDPISHHDYDGLAKIAASLDTSLTAGENYHSALPFRELLEREALDIVMIDLDVGGLTEWLKIAQLAEIHERPVVSHLATEVLAHAVAAIPNGLIVEYNPWAEPLFKEVPQLENGELILSSRPGFGLELDEAALSKLLVE